MPSKTFAHDDMDGEMNETEHQTPQNDIPQVVHQHVNGLCIVTAGDIGTWLPDRYPSHHLHEIQFVAQEAPACSGAEKRKRQAKMLRGGKVENSVTPLTIIAKLILKQEANGNGNSSNIEIPIHAGAWGTIIELHRDVTPQTLMEDPLLDGHLAVIQPSGRFPPPSPQKRLASFDADTSHAVGDSRDDPDRQEPPSSPQNEHEHEENQQQVSDEQALEKTVHALLSRSEDLVKFGKLGIKDPTDLKTWMSVHNPQNKFGIIPDFHLAMEHIHFLLHDPTARKLKIKQMEEHCSVLNLSSIHEAKAICSFGCNIPRAFVQNTMRVVPPNESYFDMIPTWEAWESGWKVQLGIALTEFEADHRSLIALVSQAETMLQALATQALDDTIFFTNGIFNYIDRTFRMFIAAHFKRETAWHIATLLATKIIDHVGSPRRTAMAFVQVGEKTSFNEATTMATLKSLDKMRYVTEIGFENVPIVVAETATFLSMNCCSMDRVESLQLSYQLEVEQLKKRVNELEAVNKTLLKRNEDLEQEEFGDQISVGYE
ncbi:MAG: hypothetical protein SGILL_003528 [Bacillariaceae sp.]